MASNRRRITNALVLALLLGAATAHAEPTARDRESARALMDDGDKKFALTDFAAALKAYQAAYALVAVPTTGVEVAKTQAALGLLVEARDTALVVTRFPKVKNEPPPFAVARGKADDLAQRLLARIPSIEITVEGPPPGTPLHVSFDGDALPEAVLAAPLKVNPGKHVVLASADGFAEARNEFSLAEGGSQKVTFSLSAAPESHAVVAHDRDPHSPATAVTSVEPKTNHGGSVLPYVGFGVGGVGLVVGVISGIASLSSASSAKTHCTGNQCTSAAQPDIDSSKSMGIVSDIGFVIGIAGVAVGVVSLLTQGSSSPTTAAKAPRLVPFVGARSGGAAFSGSF